jgi:hypothetical protein
MEETDKDKFWYVLSKRASRSVDRAKVERCFVMMKPLANEQIMRKAWMLLLESQNDLATNPQAALDEAKQTWVICKDKDYEDSSDEEKQRASVVCKDFLEKALLRLGRNHEAQKFKSSGQLDSSHDEPGK